MLALWGIHNDQPSLDLVEGGFVSIGWEELGDLRAIGPDRDALKLRLAATCPTATPGARRTEGHRMSPQAVVAAPVEVR